MAEVSPAFTFSSFMNEAKIVAATLAKIEDRNGDDADEDYQMICGVLERYQEQPHLLDPHLATLVSALMRIVKCNMKAGRDSALNAVCTTIYILCKVRGHKTIVRFLPNEVAALEPALALMRRQQPLDHTNWQTRYILLLWLSHLALAPFDMAVMDSHKSHHTVPIWRLPADQLAQTAADQQSGLVRGLLALGKLYLDNTGRVQEAAALLLVRVLTRPDVVTANVPLFLDWSKAVLVDENADVYLVRGVMFAMAMLFKLGRRDELAQGAGHVLDRAFLSEPVTAASQTVLRKMSVKVSVRAGLVFLPPRIAPWRYQRGSRSLLHNLQRRSQSVKYDAKAKEEESDDDDVPDAIEDVVERLLIGLRDVDTIVRWSAAKGVGRITARLPRHLADDVVGALLSLFSVAEKPGAWHGGCLALAELARRGLLLPTRLPRVVPILMRALKYDVLMGSHSVGAHVRDSACYASWAFARAYAPEVMAPYVRAMAPGLMVCALCDREINCRRAAAAAFQENVGRQGTFPHGIDIVTKADYFSLGNRANSFTVILPMIAAYPEYRPALSEHLLFVSARHWDDAIRELAVAALAQLVPLDPDWAESVALPYFFTQVRNAGPDLTLRHGAIIGVGELILALARHGKQSTLHAGITALVPELEATNVFSGRGGEMLRLGSCKLAEQIAESSLLTNQTMNGNEAAVLASIKASLQSIRPDIQDAAVVALTALAKCCKDDTDLCSSLVAQCIDDVQGTGRTTHATVAIRRGSTAALGALPIRLMKGSAPTVLSALVSAASGLVQPLDAEARQCAIEALLSIAAVPSDLPPEWPMASIFSAMLSGLDDYTSDRRGDVGSWVRMAAMKALGRMVHLFELSDQMATDLIAGLLKQAAEKLDKVRVVAGSVVELIHLVNCAHATELRTLLPLDTAINWASPSETFPLLVLLLPLAEYRPNILTGLAISIGGMTESLSKSAGSALLRYLRMKQDVQLLEDIGTTLIRILQQEQHVERVTLPLLQMIELLLVHDSFDALSSHTAFAADLIKTVRGEVTKCKDLSRLSAAIGIFCGLLGFSAETRQRALANLMWLLNHRYPKVRSQVASELYIALLVYEDVLKSDDALGEALNLLSETPWRGDAESWQPQRDALYPLFALKPPTKRAVVVNAAEKKEVFGTYADLVKDSVGGW